MLDNLFLFLYVSLSESSAEYLMTFQRHSSCRLKNLVRLPFPALPPSDLEFSQHQKTCQRPSQLAILGTQNLVYSSFWLLTVCLFVFMGMPRTENPIHWVIGQFMPSSFWTVNLLQGSFRQKNNGIEDTYPKMRHTLAHYYLKLKGLKPQKQNVHS